MENLRSFYQKVVKNLGKDFPVIPGIRIPYSFQQLKRMKEKFDVNIPNELMEKMQQAEGKSVGAIDAMHEVGLNWAIEFTERIIQMGMPGVHIFVMGKPELAISLRKHFK